MSPFSCIDVFSGTRSATKYFERAGYRMDYVEIEEGRDVRDYHPPRADVVIACPPCVDFSYFNRKFGTWQSKYRADRTLIQESLRVIWEAMPRFHALENVKGLQQVLGRAPYHYGPFFLWGYFPLEGLPWVPWTTSVKGTHADRSIKTEKNGGLFQWDEGKSAGQKAMWPDELAKGFFQVIHKALTREYASATPERRQGQG